MTRVSPDGLTHGLPTPVTSPLAPAVVDAVRGQLTRRITAIVASIAEASDDTLTLVILPPHDGTMVIRLPEYQTTDPSATDARFHVRGGRVLWRRAITPTVPPPALRGHSVREALADCPTLPPSAFARFLLREVNSHGGYDGGLEHTVDAAGIARLLASPETLPQRFVVKGVDARGREWWVDVDDLRAWCGR